MFRDCFEIDFIQGNFLDFKGDAIVVNTNIRLNLNYRLGKAVLAKAGDSIGDELQDTINKRFSGHDVSLGTAVSTGPGKMKGQVQNLIFVVWWASDNEYTINQIAKVHTAAIREADLLGLSSIAFPLMGRGHGVTYPVIAAGISQSINQLQRLRKSFSVEKITFASLHKEDLDGVRQLLEEKLDL